MDALEPEPGAQRIELRQEERQRPLCLPARRRPAAAELVVEDDRALVRELEQRREVVMRRAGAAVQAQQRRAVAFAGDEIPGAACFPFEGSFAHRCSVMPRFCPPGRVFQKNVRKRMLLY